MVKKLMACLGDAKRDAILSPVFVVGEVVMEVLIPLLMADIIDNGVQMGDAARLRSTGLWLVLATVASLVCGALAGHFSAHAAARFGRKRQAAAQRRRARQRAGAGEESSGKPLKVKRAANLRKSAAFY